MNRGYPAFKRAVIFSFTAHLVLFILILLSPRFPNFSRKGTIHYVNVINLPGGGGGSSSLVTKKASEEEVVETVAPVRETLRDLTTPQKLEQEALPTLRHSVDKPKREQKPKVEKKAVIQKQQVPTKTTQEKKEGSATGQESGKGSGVKIGVGSGQGGGSGFGSEDFSQVGLSTFPFTWYVQIIHSKISSNWYTAQINPGIKGDFYSTISFKIHRDGHITDLKIVKSSGIQSLDLSTQRAVRESAPFPPLPEGYEDEYLGVRLLFEHKK